MYWDSFATVSCDVLSFCHRRCQSDRLKPGFPRPLQYLREASSLKIQKHRKARCLPPGTRVHPSVARLKIDNLFFIPSGEESSPSTRVATLSCGSSADCRTERRGHSC